VGAGRTPHALVYAAASLVPGRAANAVQAMKMAEALALVRPDALAVVAAGDGPADEAALMRLYGVGRMPAMRRIPWRGGRAAPHLFGLRAAAAARTAGARAVLTRSLPTAAACTLAGIDVAYECHAPPQGAERAYWRIAAASGRLRRVVAISDALRRILADRHPEVARLDVLVAHDGVDPARFRGLPEPEEARRRAGRDPARPVAGYAGSLYRGRGVEVIMDCAAALPGRDFLVVGGGEAEAAALRAEAAGRGLANVEAVGFVDNALLAERLAVCDALLMPYQRSVMVSGGRLDTAAWMSPLKMFEYLAMGRAVVSSDLPVLREVLDERAAVLAPPDDAGAWVAALRRLEDPAARAPLAAEARRRAGEHSWERRARRILDGLLPEAAA